MNPQVNQLLQPVVAAYQERMAGYKKSFETAQALLKKAGSEYTKIVQQVHENELVKKVILQNNFRNLTFWKIMLKYTNKLDLHSSLRQKKTLLRTLIVELNF